MFRLKKSRYSSFLIPDSEVIEKLFELTMKGNFTGIIKPATSLENLDVRLAPVANQLRQAPKYSEKNSLY
jgi:hypothetical protein